MKFILFYFAFLLHFYSFAQHTQTYTTPELELHKGIELLDNQLFKAAQTAFKNYLKLPLSTEKA